jgi:hypothetical protein
LLLQKTNPIASAHDSIFRAFILFFVYDFKVSIFGFAEIPAGAAEGIASVSGLMNILTAARPAGQHALHEFIKQKK